VPDKFPEAFARFERSVDTRYIESFSELVSAFSIWAGEKWLDTSSQKHALAREARRIGIPTEIDLARRKSIPTGIGLTPTWRHEFVTIRSRSFGRYRDLRTGRFIRKP